MANTEKRDQLDKFYDRLQTLPALVGNLGLSIAEAQRRLDQNYIESLTAFTKIVSRVVAGNPPFLAVADAAADAVPGASDKATPKEAAAFVAAAADKAADPNNPDSKAVAKAAADQVVNAEKLATARLAALFVADAAAKAAADLISKMAPLAVTQYLDLFKAIAPSHYQFTETVVEVRADLRVASESELKLGASLGITKGIFSAAVNFSYLKRSASDYQAAASLRSVLNAIPADHGLLGDLLARAGTPISANFKADASFKAMLEALNEMKELPPAKP
jgi:hypothetical protein